MAKKLDVDFPAFHPITPVPGTPIYDDAIRNGHITEEDFDDFDWLTPVLDSDYMTKDEIGWELYRMNKGICKSEMVVARSFFKIDYKRDMYIWFIKVSAKMAVEAIKNKINPLDVSHYQGLVKPEWYDQ